MATSNDRINFRDVTIEDYYRNLDQWLRGFKHMNLARWKLVQNSLISLLVFWLAFQAGADPTIAVAVIALINGLSLGDLAAIWGISIKLRGEGPPVQQNKKTKNQNGEQPEKEAERR